MPRSEGGFIVFINNTPHRWVKKNSHSYQMSWPVPDIIHPYSVYGVRVEWYLKIIKSYQRDDGASVVYGLEDNQHTEFTIQCKDGVDKRITVFAPFGSITLPWRHDGISPFGVSGSDGKYFFFGQDASRWMTTNNNLKQLTLDKLTVLGSHDAGMSEFGSHTAFASKNTTVTQTRNIEQQLNLGARYFDIRPVISAGKFCCGHYSSTTGSAQGGNGQSISSIVDQINRFCNGKNELVILNISHDSNTDVGYGKYRNFNKDEWIRFFNEMLNIKNLCTCNNNLLCEKIEDRKTVGELTALGSCVVVRLESDFACQVLNEQSPETKMKFCQKQDLNIFDSYSGSNTYTTMRNDQFKKMQQNSNDRNKLFLLSWTLTQDASNAISATLGGSTSILNLASAANMHLDEDLFNEINSNHDYPNIVYIDKIETPEGIFAAQMTNDMRFYKK